MIVATAQLLGTITATAVIMAIQTGGCADATVNVNNSLFNRVASGGVLNIPVKNTDGTEVGLLQFGIVEVPDATVENSDATFSEAIPSGDTLVLEDYTVRLYVDGVLQDTDTVPAMNNININVN